MSPEAEREDRLEPLEGDAYVRQQLASIDGSMFSGMPVDGRFESGVPEGQRGNALDFIQMTGLTRPPLPPASAGLDGAFARAPLYADLNASAPLSFYEAGVSDVDERLDGSAFHRGLLDATLDADLVPNRSAEPLTPGAGASRSFQAFRDIVAGLQGAAPVEASHAAALPVETEGYSALEDEQPCDRSASGALLSLVEELESLIQVSSHRASAPGDMESSETAEETPSDDDGDDFDTLVSSRTGPADEVPEESDPEPVAAPASDVDFGTTTGDWDALLDTLVQAAPKTPADPPPAPAAKVFGGSGALLEAEQLMQALERKPRVLQTPPPPVSAPVPAATPVALEEPLPVSAELLSAVPAATEASPRPGPPDSEEADPNDAYDFSAGSPRRRSRRHSRAARNGRKLFMVVLCLGVFLGALAGLWYFVTAPGMLQPEELAAHAERLIADQDYTEASSTYLQLASRMPAGDTERANAEFQAAFALTLGPEHSMDDTRLRYESALALFQKFTESHPQHPKRTRALSIMARLHFQLQEFEKAISILRDQVKPAEDPAAALSMLRYLARACSLTGHYEEAETSYLQAATLPGNYNAEADYLELGDLFRRRAGLAEDSAERQSMEETAVSYWRRALQVPGIAPGDRDVLEERLQWLSFTEKTAGTAPEMAAPASTPVDAGGTPERSPLAASSIPVPADDAGRAEAPGAEFEALIAPVPSAPATSPEAAAAPAAAQRDR